MEIPKLIAGGISVDDRGSLRFVNDFDFSRVKRFYQVQNHRRGFIRAWHGHKIESKYVYVAKGSALIGTAPLLDESPNVAKFVPVSKFVVSDKQPKILFIPSNYYNGAMTLEEGTIIQYFSTTTLEEAKEDDIRLPFDTWNIWQEDFR